MFKLFLLGVVANLGMLSILNLNNKGEAGGDGGDGGASSGDGGQGGASGANTFSQDDVNNIVAREVKKVQERFGDYTELKKFKEEQENLSKQREEQDLEKKQEYDRLKEGWMSKEKEYQSKLNDAQVALNNERINNSLYNEVMKNNGYEDAVKLVREQARLTEDGKIVIKGKNQQGVDDDLDVAEGVKQFLKDRPYLVKATGQGGANTSGAGETGGEGGQGGDSGDLADQMINAKNRGDVKEYRRLKDQIRSKHNLGAVLT